MGKRNRREKMFFNCPNCGEPIHTRNMKPRCQNCGTLLEIKRKNPEVSVRVRRPPHKKIH